MEGKEMVWERRGRWVATNCLMIWEDRDIAWPHFTISECVTERKVWACGGERGGRGGI